MNDFYIKYFPILLKMPVDKFGRIIRDNTSAIGDENRIVGCSDLNTNRSFSVLLGTSTNKLYFMYLPKQPVTLETDHGFWLKPETTMFVN